MQAASRHSCFLRFCDGDKRNLSVLAFELSINLEDSLFTFTSKLVHVSLETISGTQIICLNFRVLFVPSTSRGTCTLSLLIIPDLLLPSSFCIRSLIPTISMATPVNYKENCHSRSGYLALPVPLSSCLHGPRVHQSR